VLATIKNPTKKKKKTSGGKKWNVQGKRLPTNNTCTCSCSRISPPFFFSTTKRVYIAGTSHKRHQ
jgi:thiamine pyrophosphokinase